MRNHTVRNGQGVQRASTDPVDGSAEARFGAKVTPMPNGCWAWRNDLTKYGAFYVGRVAMPAHRFAYEAMGGVIPEDHDLHHKCENPGCVNPAHLVPLTRKDHQLEHSI